MDKYKTSILIVFTIIIVILVFFLVKNINNNNNNLDNKKIVAELKYMDTKLTSLLNSINNISLENYKVSVTKTSTNTNSNTDTNTNTADEQYELKEEGILTGKEEIDWEILKNEVELLYSRIPTMTLDLFNLNLNQEEILGFNKELDELTTIVKQENKEKALIKLADLYRYLPVYASNCSDDTSYVKLLEIKSNIIKAYVYTNLENWDEVKNNIRRAIESYLSILNNIDEKNINYDKNKLYVILNELESSADMQNKDVFLIKYKTFLEETEKLKY